MENTKSLNTINNSYLLSLNCGEKFIHNSRINFTNGILCEDCGRFIKKGTLEYFMTSGIFDIRMAIHNIDCNIIIHEKNKDLYIKLKILIEKLENKENLLKMTKKEAITFMNETYKILSYCKISDTDACKTLF